MKLVFVTLDNLEEYWARTRSLIADACKTSFGKFEAIDIMKELMMGRMNMWIVEDGKIKTVVITQIIQFPRNKVCRLICCVGDGMNEWLPFLANIEKWAKEQGCSFMEPECRKGWAKVLKPLGYEEGHYLLGKAL